MIRCVLSIALAITISSAASAQVAWIAGTDNPATGPFPFTRGMLADMYMPSDAFPNGAPSPNGSPILGTPGTTAFTWAGTNPASPTLIGAGDVCFDTTTVPPTVIATDGTNALTFEDHPEYFLSSGFGCTGGGAAPGITTVGAALTAAGSPLVLPITGMAFDGSSILGPTLWMMDSVGTVEGFTYSRTAPFLTRVFFGLPSPVPAGNLPTDLAADASLVFASSIGVTTDTVQSFIPLITGPATIASPPLGSAIGLAINGSQTSQTLFVPNGPFHVVITDGITVRDALNPAASFQTGGGATVSAPYGMGFCPDMQYRSAVCAPTGNREAISITNASTTVLAPSFSIPGHGITGNGLVPGFTGMFAIIGTTHTAPIPVNFAGDLCSTMISPANAIVQFNSPVDPANANCVLVPGGLVPLMTTISVQFGWFDFNSGDYRFTDELTVGSALP